MISESARQSVHEIFSRAVVANLAMNDGDAVTVERICAAEGNGLPGAAIVVLTISSFVFRLLTVFHVDPTGEVGRYFTRGDAEQPFDAAFGEIGNMCCGAMNRELGSHFPHLGMSTPHMLQAACAGYLDELHPGFRAQYRICINDDLALHATVCLCAYAPLDFRVLPPVAPEVSGELELF